MQRFFSSAFQVQISIPSGAHDCYCVAPEDSVSGAPSLICSEGYHFDPSVPVPPEDNPYADDKYGYRTWFYLRCACIIECLDYFGLTI